MPARVEPVNDTMSMPGMRGDRRAHRRPVAVDQVEHAGGHAGLVHDSANTMPLSGAISLGFSTMVQPAASAGATLQAIWFTGQFHGVMKPHTPTGSRRMRVVPRFSSNA